MDNWYKKAMGSKFTDPDTGQTMEGIDMSLFDETTLQKIKRHLEEKHPRINWTMEKVYEWVNKNFIGKPKPFKGPKNKVHNW